MNALKRTLTSIIAALLIGPASSQAEDLLQTYQTALDSDPVISAQKFAFEATSDSQREVKSLYFPNISLNADYTKTKTDVTAPSTSLTPDGNFDTDVKSYDVTLLQPLYRRDYITQLRQAEATTRQAEADLNQAYQDLILRVAQAYFDVLAARDNLEFASAEKEAITRQLDQAKQRFEVGLIAITDVHESQAAHDIASADEIVAQNNLARSRETLREITGVMPQKLAGLTEEIELSTPEPDNIEEWVNSALQNNFKIISAEAATEVALQSLEQQRGNRHPKLDLVASYGVNDVSGIPTTEREETSTSFGLQFSVPLYQGGGISAGIRRANAQLSQARDTLEQQHRSIQSEASQAYLSVVASISRVQALKQAVISSESALKATEAGYEVGTRTTVDVLNVRRELFRTQADYARSRYDYIIVSMRLRQTAGLLAIDDVRKVNAWLTQN